MNLRYGAGFKAKATAISVFSCVSYEDTVHGCGAWWVFFSIHFQCDANFNYLENSTPINQTSPYLVSPVAKFLPWAVQTGLWDLTLKPGTWSYQFMFFNYFPMFMLVIYFSLVLCEVEHPWPKSQHPWVQYLGYQSTLQQRHLWLHAQDIEQLYLCSPWLSVAQSLSRLPRS